MNMTIQPLIGMQNPQQPIGGLLGAFTPYSGGSLTSPPAVQGGLMAGMGPWSQMAYQMAGSPKQGGAWAPVATPPAPPGGSSSGSSGGSALGSIATGLLGTVLKNPSLIKGAYNGISGLLGGGASGSSILAGGSPALSSVGTGAVAPAVDSAAADASAALSGADAGAGAAGAGLLGGAGTGATGANAIASGTAAAGQTGAAGGSLLGAAAPLAVAGLVGLIGTGAISDKANDAGNSAMSQWMKASGATFKPTYTNSGQNTFGTNNGLLGASSKPGTWYDSKGQPMTPAQVAAAITAWGKANGVNTGNINYAGP